MTWQLCECSHLGGVSPDGITQHLDHFKQDDGCGRCTRCNCAQFTFIGNCDRDGKLNDFE